MRRSFESVEDYLKAILELGGPEGRAVPGGALAAHLGVRPASVTGMLQKLARGKPALVRYERHRGVRLAPAGRRRALEIVRHHRLLERFLHDVLDYGWDEVHAEAERLEHFISERLEARMAAKLGHPATDPHGHPIPAKDGGLPERLEVPLAQWACGVPARISSVSDRNAAVLRKLRAAGLQPGAEVTVLAGQRGPGLAICLLGRRVRLGASLARAVWVVESSGAGTGAPRAPKPGARAAQLSSPSE